MGDNFFEEMRDNFFEEMRGNKKPLPRRLRFTDAALKIRSYWKFSGKKSLSLENKIGKAFMHMIDIMKGNA